MASCYHCGKYIAKNEGYRRKVQTSESTRVYISSRPGGSFGKSYGLRTLCIECTKVNDNGSGSSASFFSVIWAVSFFLGLLVLARTESFGFLSVFLIFGGPAWLYIIIGEMRKNYRSSASSLDSINTTSVTKELYTEFIALSDSILEDGISIVEIYRLHYESTDDQEIFQKIVNDFFSKGRGGEEWMAYVAKDALLKYLVLCDGLVDIDGKSEDEIAAKMFCLIKIIPMKDEEDFDLWFARVINLNSTYVVKALT